MRVDHLDAAVSSKTLNDHRVLEAGYQSVLGSVPGAGAFGFGVQPDPFYRMPGRETVKLTCY